MESANISPLSLSRKIAIVTGASRGIGAAIALDLARRGANITLTYTSASSQESVEALVTQIKALPHKPHAISIRADLYDPASASRIVSETAAVFGDEEIDILVNNAGVEVVSPIKDITPELFAKSFDLNVRAPVLLAAAVAPRLRHQGRIINIGSVGGRAGFESLSMYCTSKAALEGLTRSWAAELGARGITVNCVTPGPIESEMLARIPPEIVARQKASTPVEKRAGTVEEVAHVVGWLAGPEASWVSGQTICASGGWQML